LRKELRGRERGKELKERAEKGVVIGVDKGNNKRTAKKL
jgi:hypothetical protein